MKKVKIYKRICPKCNKEILYNTYGGWYTSTKNNCLCRECASYLRTQHDSDLSVLLSDTNEAFYWIGFLMADGSFTNRKRLTLGLSIKDKEHLLKFANFIHFTGKLDENLIRCTIKVQDINVVPKIMDKFDFKPIKTYNSPKSLFLRFNKDLATSLLIGYIDGDGCILKQYKRKDSFLRIKCHSNWLNLLNEIVILLNLTNSAKINNKGYAELSISKTKILHELKLFTITNNLPILTRKWDNIDLSFVSKYDIFENKRELIINDLLLGILSKTQIAKKYNVSNALITKISKNLI